MQVFSDLQTRLGYTFRDENLLRLALTHSSRGHEAVTAHNQRLEFLGDSVLELALTRELYEKFPESDEGLLTKSRAKFVNAGTLVKHATALGLGAQILMSRGEEATGGRERPSILADAFEALLGAIFLDGGFEAVSVVVLKEFAADFKSLSEPADENPKGDLQELLQSSSASAPVYQVVNASGPHHDRNFECAVFHADQELARGIGKTKKNAETAAALAALEKIHAANKPSPTQ